MKPEFTRPFDLDHAMSGAPIATVARGPARFVAYVSHADSSCRVIILDQNSVVGTRRESGRTNECGAIDNPHDLVMIPLGMIDGKPVFVGDEVATPTGMKWAATPTCRTNGSLGDCTWPAPAKVYPVTQMTDDNMSSAWSDCPAGYKGLRKFANATLRHAIDAGQIVTKDEHESALILLGEHLRGIAIAPDAARDMAIAEAVRDACYVAAMNCSAGFEGTVVRQIRLQALAAIIATIK